MTKQMFPLGFWLVAGYARFLSIGIGISDVTGGAEISAAMLDASLKPKATHF